MTLDECMLLHPQTDLKSLQQWLSTTHSFLPKTAADPEIVQTDSHQGMWHGKRPAFMLLHRDSERQSPSRQVTASDLWIVTAGLVH